jgi:hypothetical protein
LADYDEIMASREAEGLTDNGDPTVALHIAITTPSNEWNEAQGPETLKDFKARTERYVVDAFGKQNVLLMVWHYDEETPHLHAIVLPLEWKQESRGRKPKDPAKALGKRFKWHRNASGYLGDSHTQKVVMSRRQDEWHALVADLGILRGQRAGLTGARQEKGALRTSKLKAAAAELAKGQEELAAGQEELATGQEELAAQQAQFQREKDEWSRSIADIGARIISEAEETAKANAAAIEAAAAKVMQNALAIEMRDAETHAQLIAQQSQLDERERKIDARAKWIKAAIALLKQQGVRLDRASNRLVLAAVKTEPPTAPAVRERPLRRAVMPPLSGQLTTLEVLRLARERGHKIVYRETPKKPEETAEQRYARLMREKQRSDERSGWIKQRSLAPVDE